MAKSKKKTAPPVPATYITVIRCNLDDVICGAYPKLPAAKARMAEALADPDTILKKNAMETWDASGLIAVSIFRVQGPRVRKVAQEAFADKQGPLGK